MNSAIYEKIQKVLELAKRGGTEAESETAMQKVLELLAKHNLIMSDIEQREVKDEDIIDMSEDVKRGNWIDCIYHAISALYFCQSYSKTNRLNGKSFNSVVIVGRESNVKVARETARYLVELGESLTKDSGQDILWRNSFKNGFATRISERCREQKKAAMANNLQIAASNNTCTALTVKGLYEVTLRENSDYLKAKGITLRMSSSRTSSRNSDGYNAGRAAGNSASLRYSNNTRQIGR